MNLKQLKAGLRDYAREDLFSRRADPLVRRVHEAIVCVAVEFPGVLRSLPAWTLRFVRAQIASPKNPTLFSTTKLKALDARIRKAEASLCCPYCEKKFTANGLPGHKCNAAPDLPGSPARHGTGSRSLMAVEQHVARKRVGLPESARLSKQVAFDLKQIPVCRVCGCIDLDCEDCIRKTGQPCSWVEPDLCSACVPSGKAVAA